MDVGKHLAHPAYHVNPSQQLFCLNEMLLQRAANSQVSVSDQVLEPHHRYIFLLKTVHATMKILSLSTQANGNLLLLENCSFKGSNSILG